MPVNSEAKLISFVLRFVYEDVLDTTDSLSWATGQAADAGLRPSASWHGMIRHVQSDAERHFTHWAEAEEFIAAYVDVGEPTDR